MKGSTSPSWTGSLGGNGLIHLGPSPSRDRFCIKPIIVSSLFPDPILGFAAGCRSNLTIKPWIRITTEGSSPVEQKSSIHHIENLWYDFRKSRTLPNLDHIEEASLDPESHFWRKHSWISTYKALDGLYCKIAHAIVHEKGIPERKWSQKSVANSCQYKWATVWKEMKSTPWLQLNKNLTSILMGHAKSTQRHRAFWDVAVRTYIWWGIKAFHIISRRLFKNLRQWKKLYNSSLVRNY